MQRDEHEVAARLAAGAHLRLDAGDIRIRHQMHRRHVDDPRLVRRERLEVDAEGVGDPADPQPRDLGDARPHRVGLVLVHTDLFDPVGTQLRDRGADAFFAAIEDVVVGELHDIEAPTAMADDRLVLPRREVDLRRLVLGEGGRCDLARGERRLEVRVGDVDPEDQVGHLFVEAVLGIIEALGAHQVAGQAHAALRHRLEAVGCEVEAGATERFQTRLDTAAGHGADDRVPGLVGPVGERQRSFRDVDVLRRAPTTGCDRCLGDALDLGAEFTSEGDERPRIRRQGCTSEGARAGSVHRNTSRVRVTNPSRRSTTACFHAGSST